MPYFVSKNKIISIKLNKPNNCCIFFSKIKDLVSLKSLETTYCFDISMLLFLLVLTLRNPYTIF